MTKGGKLCRRVIGLIKLSREFIQDVVKMIGIITNNRSKSNIIRTYLYDIAAGALFRFFPSLSLTIAMPELRPSLTQIVLLLASTTNLT